MAHYTQVEMGERDEQGFVLNLLEKDGKCVLLGQLPSVIDKYLRAHMTGEDTYQFVSQFGVKRRVCTYEAMAVGWLSEKLFDEGGNGYETWQQWFRQGPWDDCDISVTVTTVT